MTLCWCEQRCQYGTWSSGAFGIIISLFLAYLMLCIFLIVGIRLYRCVYVCVVHVLYSFICICCQSTEIWKIHEYSNLSNGIVWVLFFSSCFIFNFKLKFVKLLILRSNRQNKILQKKSPILFLHMLSDGLTLICTHWSLIHFQGRVLVRAIWYVMSQLNFCKKTI